MLSSRLRATLLALTLLPLIGCVGLALGGGPGKPGATAATGPVKANLNAPIDRVFAAAQTTLKSKQLSVLSKSQNAASARVTSKYPDGQEITISIAPITDAVSEVTIRVGAPGDPARARDLLAGIKARL